MSSSSYPRVAATPGDIPVQEGGVALTTDGALYRFRLRALGPAHELGNVRAVRRSTRLTGPGSMAGHALGPAADPDDQDPHPGSLTMVREAGEAYHATHLVDGGLKALAEE